jgi:hypothetical protein
LQKFEEKSGRKSPLGRSRRRWKVDIKMCLEEMEWEDVD